MDVPENLTCFSNSTPTPAPSETNVTVGSGDSPPPEAPISILRILLLTFLAILILGTFAWNLLVLGTVTHVRSFRRVPHNLVGSMAASDMLVATLVMPLSVAHELSGWRWKLGRQLCHLWITSDVLCCTASIWNVTAIALDRYWSITRHLDYTMRIRRRACYIMIALAWTVSTVIALAPMVFGWGESYSEATLQCQVSRELSYAVFSTVSAFYLPLAVVLFVYWKIYQAAKARAAFRKSNSVRPVPAAAKEPQPHYSVHQGTVSFRVDRDSRLEHKEHKAAIMVGILIGVFAICWLPFFTLEFIRPLCSCDLPDVWKSLFLWLGYCNSLFNPIIYTAFNKTYTHAFREFFCK